MTSSPEETLARTQRRMRQTIGPVSPQELDRARAHVKSETAKIQEDDDSKASLSKSSIARAADIEELKKASTVASQFNQGLDKVTDVLLILVLKYGRASSMLVGVLFGITIALAVQVYNTISLANARSEVSNLLREMEEIQKKQGAILATAADAVERSKAAEARAKAAEEAAPEIVVDSEGQATLVVKGNSVAPLSKSVTSRKGARKSAPKRTSKGVAIPLDF